MRHDLFEDVVRPSVSVGQRRWSTVPVSLALHLAALVALVIAPLVATDVLPAPRRAFEYIQVIAPVQPPPPAPLRHKAPRAPVHPSDAVPLAVPDRIAPETGIEPPDTSFESAGSGEGTIVGSTLSGTGLVMTEPPPPAASTPPVRVGGKIREPRKIGNVAPIYPPLAQAARREGMVILEAVIGEDGAVRDVRVLRSVPLLDEAATEAVRQWVFTPTLLNGQPVPVVMTVTVTFRLK